jgi:hypothetical protein
MVFGIVLLVFVGFAIAITFRPASIIALALSVYAFEQWAQANSGFFGVHASLINLAFGILCLYAMVCVVLRSGNPLNPMTGSMWIWAAMYLLAAISCLWSIDRSLSIFLFRYNLPYVVTFVALVPLVIQDRDDMRVGLMTALAFGSIVMLLLLVGTQIHAFGRTIEMAKGTGVVDRVGQMRTRLAPLAVGEFGGQLLIVAVLMNFRGLARIWQQLRWVLVILALVLIYRSGSRGQLIASLASIVMFITFSRGTKKAAGWIAAGVSTMMILGMAAWSFSGFADQRGRWDLDKMQSTFAATRLEYVATLLEFWMESSPLNWMFGLGSSASYDNRILGRYCHVTTVEVLAELGFVGFALFIAFFVLVSRDMVRLYQVTRDSEVDRGVAVTLGALFTFGVILSFKQGSFLTNTFMFGSGLMISRQAAVMQIAYQREQVRELQRRWQAYYAQFGQSPQLGQQAFGQTSPQA